MMKKILYVSLLLICAVLSPAYGQTDTLIFFNPVPSATSFVKGETLTITVNVTFIDGEGDPTATYPLNSLLFGYSVNGTTAEPQSGHPGVPELLHNKTSTVEITVPIINGLFQEGGGHVIIIWPVTTVPTGITPTSLPLSDIIYVQSASAFEENRPDPEPYPNPTVGTIHVETPTGAEVTVYTLSGQNVASNMPNGQGPANNPGQGGTNPGPGTSPNNSSGSGSSGSGSGSAPGSFTGGPPQPHGTTRNVIDLSKLPPGIYIMSIRAGEHVYHKPIIKL